ncbi:exopolysaccharide biosynthesis polyprenyl glycosylphosphotransferase [Actinomadura rayongensis]|nr:exopolysaccharide biosynthesis polyprenyl glycosylphosphotransferase [Actinomadura rayongensis]
MGTQRPVAKTLPDGAQRRAPTISGSGAPEIGPRPRPRARRSPLPFLLALSDAGLAFAAARAMLGGRAVDLAAAAGGALVLLNLAAGLYRVRRLHVLSDARPLAVRAAAIVAALGVLAPAVGPARPAVWFPAAVLFVLAPGSVRLAARHAVRIGRRGPLRPPLALIVGTGVLSDYLVWSLRRRPEIGLLPLGRLAAGLPDAAGDAPDLRRLIAAHRVETAVVVLDEIEPEDVEPTVRACAEAGCETLVVPLSGGAHGLPPGPSGRVRYLAGVPCVPLTRRPYGPVARCGKRLFDLAGALALLAVLWPVLLACAAAVRRESGPGVLFRQSRLGLAGRPFVLLKFRTLRPADDTESDTRWSVHGDARIGPVGAFLRRTSLDELPQLWNVVRGDMSLVGPRPERPHFVRRFAETCPGYVLRHRVPVGMTGWAQVHGLRGDTSIEMRARFDNHYIDHWSFAMDLRILLLTFNAMILRRTA